MEIWQDIKNFPGYQISNQGRVKSFKQDKNGKILKPKISQGYYSVDLRREGATYNHLVHRLVLSTFSPIEGWELLTVNHKDGDRANNSLENLEWMSFSENAFHARAVLRSGNATQKVHIIKLNGEEEWYNSVTEAAKGLGVAKATISRWVNKQRSYEGKYRMVEYV